MTNKKRVIIVHCEFAESGKTVKESLYEVFRTFAQRKIRKERNLNLYTKDAILIEYNCKGWIFL